MLYFDMPSFPCPSQVYKLLAPISSIAPSPCGSFLAVGTSTGAMLVFDVRGDPVNPWFQVGHLTVFDRAV